MKLKLEKQKITKLSKDELQNVKGGGNLWSDLRTGNCNYSTNNPDSQMTCEGTHITISCISQPYKS